VNTDVKTGRLTGKVAIVTGAAPRGPGVGNGSAVAILFAREGASVVLVNRSEERARLLQREIEAEGGRCIVVPADMTREADASRVVQSAVDAYGRVDILHNNVGFSGKSGVENIREAEWDAVLAANLKSIVWSCKYTVPHMRRQGAGSIINVSSIAGAVGLRDASIGLVAYSAAKAGVIGLSRSLAAEHSVDGIRVNCIVVGMVDTPMVARLPVEAREQRRLSVPLRTTGSGWDVGWAAVFLASDEARWITGIELPVDAGQMRLMVRPGSKSND
jgi:NAD(P)-dependent dehydrogenase (short-subunit alcohol dehydrogenase family)